MSEERRLPSTLGLNTNSGGNNNDGQPEKEFLYKRKLPARGEALFEELNRQYDEEYSKD